jgi:hypothetical protein
MPMFLFRPVRELRNTIAWHTGRAQWMFIHVPKNAGVTLRKNDELAGRLIAADPYFHISKRYTASVKAAMRVHGEHHGFQHARWRDLHPGVTARLSCVAVIRNPWARTVSRWQFGRRAVAAGLVAPGQVAETFAGFLEERHIYGQRDFYWHRAIRGWYPQRDHVTDESGTIRCDILRMEHLQDEATRYFGLTEPLRRNNAAPEDRTGLAQFLHARPHPDRRRLVCGRYRHLRLRL